MEQEYQPLKGIRVLDLTLAGAGPSCTKLLREAGAEVIWIEPPGGVSTRHVHKYDFYCNGKKSVMLNLKTDDGMAALKKLLAESDVFVCNYRPGAVERLHLTYDEVKRIRPDIVYATLTGFGETGPLRDSPGYDTVAFWSKSGLMRDIAEKGTLVVPPIAAGDIGTGLALYGGITTALYHRLKTGEGCHVYTSLLADALYLNHDAIVETQYGEEYPKSRLMPRRALLNTYRCSDEKWITISVPADFDRYFPRLMKALHLDEAYESGRWNTEEDTMHEGAPELVALLDEAFGRMTQQEAFDLMRSIDVPVEKVKATTDTFTDAQIQANNYLFRRKATVPPTTGEEEILIPSAPVKYNSDTFGTQDAGKGPAPGEHTVEILKRFGYTDTELEQMRGDGSIFY